MARRSGPGDGQGVATPEALKVRADDLTYATGLVLGVTGDSEAERVLIAGVEVTAPSAKPDVAPVVSEVSLEAMTEVPAQLTQVRDRLVGMDGGLMGEGRGHRSR
jgi:hypothetical protein